MAAPPTAVPAPLDEIIAAVRAVARLKAAAKADHARIEAARDAIVVELERPRALRVAAAYARVHAAAPTEAREAAADVAANVDAMAAVCLRSMRDVTDALAHGAVDVAYARVHPTTPAAPLAEVTTTDMAEVCAQFVRDMMQALSDDDCVDIAYTTLSEASLDALGTMDDDEAEAVVPLCASELFIGLRYEPDAEAVATCHRVAQEHGIAPSRVRVAKHSIVRC